MKRNSIIISLASAALLFTAVTSRAEHEKDCKEGTHGTVSARTDSTITVGGKTFSTTTLSREDRATASVSNVKVGDKVCIHTTSTDSKDASKIMVLNHDDKAAYASPASSTERGYTTMSNMGRKAHEKMCKGQHGTITDKTANTITVDGKTYALKINTPVNKQEEPLLPKTSKIGDRVCFATAKAADGSQQITTLMGIDQDSDRTRVRETDTDPNIKIKDSPNKIEVETPDKKIEVK